MSLNAVPDLGSAETGVVTLFVKELLCVLCASAVKMVFIDAE
jgi:hypothetical protein